MKGAGYSGAFLFFRSLKTNKAVPISNRTNAGL